MPIHESALARAVAQGELVLHYQPVLATRSLEVAGYEALVRWDRDGRGLLPAAEFIPLAESSDLICEVDTWVLNEALRQGAAWSRAADGADLTISVNVSGRHLGSPRIRDDVTTALERHGVGSVRLVLEITETVPLDEFALEHLHELRELGVSLALDDLGTGHSSLEQLARLPLDVVKLDRSYLDLSRPDATARLRQAVAACHARGLVVVGEGVEHPDQLALLRELDVAYAQGFLLGLPAAPAHVPAPGERQITVRQPP